MTEQRRYEVSGSRAIWDGRTTHYTNDKMVVVAESPEQAIKMAKDQRNILATRATLLEGLTESAATLTK